MGVKEILVLSFVLAAAAIAAPAPLPDVRMSSVLIWRKEAP